MNPPEIDLEKIEFEENHTPEEIAEIIGDENGETFYFQHKNERFKVSRQPPRNWKCTRCGNVYKELTAFCPSCHNKKFEFICKDKEDLIDFYIFNPDYFSYDIECLLVNQEKTLLTELIAKAIEKELYIYSVRDDKSTEIWVYKNGIYVPQGRTYITEQCRKILKENITTYLLNAILLKVQSDSYIEQEEFFKNRYPYEICVENGILNLKTKELSNFNPEKIHFIKIPVKYDPEAICPNIDIHLKTVLKSEEDAKVFYELTGYSLIKEGFLEIAFILVGNGRNGKSKTLELKKRFLGAENCASISLQRMERDDFSICELHNKLANLCGDMGNRALKNPHNFKELVGRDEISAKRKFLNDIKFVNYAKMLFACNELPKTYDTTDGFWSKWVLFEFPYTFKSQEEIDVLSEKEKKKCKVKDANIIEKITTPEELSGLLNKALEGLNTVLFNKKFSSSQGVEEIKNMWIRKSDSFLAFCLENIEEDDECRIEKEILRNKYREYCKTHKVKKKETDKGIKLSLEENYGVGEKRIEDIWYWIGIKFKSGNQVQNLDNSKTSIDIVTPE